MSNQVTFVTPSLNPLGNAGQLPLWCETLQESGWGVTVFSLRDPVGSNYAPRYPGVELHCLALKPREWSRWGELKALVTERPVDVLHFWDCPAQICWWLGRRAGLWATTSFDRRLNHRLELLSRTGGSRHLPQVDLVFDPQLAAEAEVNPTWSSDSVSTALSAVLAPKAIPRTLERRELTRARLREELALPPDVKLVVAAAEFKPETHCKDLVWGIDQLKIIRDDIHLLLLGSGRQRNQLERFLSLTEAESRTHFLGDRPDGPEIVAAADIFWQADLTNYLPEGLLLALAAGVPVVSAYGPNTSSVVLPQQTAWVADTSARYQYARWSKFFLEEPQRAAQLAAQAIEQTVGRFSPGPVKTWIREVYSRFGRQI